jgi:hypothetical protein
MMLGTKSAEVLDVIMDWADRNIHHQPKKSSCKPGKGGH